MWICEVRRTLRRRGWRYALALWVATHLRWLWDEINDTDLVHALVNENIINGFVAAMEPRPARLSTKSDYTSWDSLIDKTWSDRHLPPIRRKLPPMPPPGPPPALEDVVDLFKRPRGQGRPAKKSTLLFPFFAQWFVDGFLRTDPANSLKNTSTHEIDLSQLYGSDPKVTERPAGAQGWSVEVPVPSKEATGSKEEYPPWYYLPDGEVNPEFAGRSDHRP